ncbi:MULTISPECIES: PTS lactose/cellobiose transporter subunit IIA [Paenibacillus]|uniref:PTS lactose/cellobiose transporter subunit IIA n=1 Tax=Paenibacillus ottowii TaxID=2315729 RepID=A0ABY3B3V5_9BACL|nr:PTS lactose/cellobiose transporter subunit IIA [Paenibacillus polymyxa]TQR97892.1 PTS lactose/cellobiose transporter subunit IIA [Paenibacillus ottowii]
MNNDESAEHDVNMEDMDDTEIVFQIILYAGNARSSAMEAIELAKAGKFQESREELASAKKELVSSHKIQTRIIRKEAAGEKTEMSVMMVHAQDHLMNAITIHDMASEFINLYERIDQLGLKS